MNHRYIQRGGRGRTSQRVNKPGANRPMGEKAIIQSSNIVNISQQTVITPVPYRLHRQATDIFNHETSITTLAYNYYSNHMYPSL